MAKYELPDHVVKNIIYFADNATIKGSEAVAVLEIKSCLSKPVDGAIEPPKEPDNPKP
jgi:hypothetical protein